MLYTTGRRASLGGTQVPELLAVRLSVFPCSIRGGYSIVTVQELEGMVDFYDLLQISSTDCLEKDLLHKAWKRASLQHHPDKGRKGGTTNQDGKQWPAQLKSTSVPVP